MGLSVTIALTPVCRLPFNMNMYSFSFKVNDLWVKAVLAFGTRNFKQLQDL